MQTTEQARLSWQVIAEHLFRLKNSFRGMHEILQQVNGTAQHALKTATVTFKPCPKAMKEDQDSHTSPI